MRGLAKGLKGSSGIMELQTGFGIVAAGIRIKNKRRSLRER